MATNNITNPTGTINIYNNTDKTITPNRILLNNNLSNVCIPTKICKACRTIKYITEFYKDKSRCGGYTYICKICNKNHKNEYTKENNDKFNNENIKTKLCNKCGVIKSFIEFSKNKDNKDGHYYFCKDFSNNINKEYREKNKQEIAEYRKAYNKEHKDDITKRRKQYEYDHKFEIAEKKKQYYIDHKDEKQKYYQDNKDALYPRKLLYILTRLTNDPVFRLIHNNRTRIRQALCLKNKTDHSIDLLGCSPIQFKKWIYWQLPYDMTNEEFKDKYQIDHVRAISTFDMSIPDNQYIAFHWSNCQPLLTKKNLSKGNRRNIWSEIMQEMKVKIYLNLNPDLICD